MVIHIDFLAILVDRIIYAVPCVASGLGVLYKLKLLEHVHQVWVG